LLRAVPAESGAGRPSASACLLRCLRLSSLSFQNVSSSHYNLANHSHLNSGCELLSMSCGHFLSLCGNNSTRNYMALMAQFPRRNDGKRRLY
jgi:hypothetical protein